MQIFRTLKRLAGIPPASRPSQEEALESEPHVTMETAPSILEARARLNASIQISTDHLPSHGVRWGAYAQKGRENIAALTDPTEALHFAQSKIGFEHRGGVSHEGKFTAMYENELRASYPQFAHLLDGFGDTPSSSPETIYTHKDRPVSNVLFYYTRVIFSCITHLPKRPEVILEIGGGYGAPARLWMNNPLHNPRVYMILDMPESLFFSDVFLRTEFGDDSVWYLREGETLTPELAAKFKFILVPLPLHAQLRQMPIDLVINTGSLQEMEENWVDFYKEWLNDLNCRWFYTLNYFAQPLNALFESCNVWSPRILPNWRAHHLKWNPPLVRMQSERNFLEAFYEKDASIISETTAQQLLDFHCTRSPSGETFVEVMDIVRTFPESAQILKKALSYASSLPWDAKETLWLVDKCLGTPAFPEVDAVMNLKRRLEIQRAGGIEAYH